MKNPDLFQNAFFIWPEKTSGPDYVYFRKNFSISRIPDKAELHLHADSRYQVWVNGRYLGQGPTPWKPPHLFYDTYDVRERLVAGDNCVAVLAHYFGIATHTYTLSEPGLVAELEYGDGSESRRIFTDRTWKVLRSQAWEKNNLRRTWATGFVEYKNASLEPSGWNEIDFDDHNWADPVTRPVKDSGIFFHSKMTPALEEWFENAPKLLSTWRVSEKQKPEEKLSAFLDRETYSPMSPLLWNAEREGDLTIDSPVALTFDLGAEVVGQIEFEISAAEGTLIEYAGAELLQDGRVWLYRKGGDYANRYLARDGRQTHRDFAYNGFRYLHFVVREGKGPVTIHRIGVWRRQARLKIRNNFMSDDALLQQIWDTSLHTLRVSSQEIQVDCPTREQAAYWGDGLWCAYWTFRLTGDASYFKHLLISAAHTQLPSGQLTDSVFTGQGQRSLFDYSLIFIWGLAVYLEATGDRETVREILPTVRRVLDWYASRVGKTGLLEIDSPGEQAAGRGITFIDHPGLGWHVPNDPGIDRRGISAGLNCFFLIALEKFRSVAEALGEPTALGIRSADLRELIRKSFWNKDARVFADSRLADGSLSDQVSQQTNILAVISGVCPEKDARDLLGRMLTSRDPKLARCTPYFWIYFAQALRQVGMEEELLGEIKRLWGAMLAHGATTWWECFDGDSLDSLCHPWSCVPLDVLSQEGRDVF